MALQTEQVRRASRSSPTAAARRAASSRGPLQQVEGDALRRLGPDAGQPPQLVDQPRSGAG